VPTKLKPLARGIFDADTAHIELEQAGSEEDEEIEDFIKKRVKQGTGRDYDAIVKKDIVNYQKINKQEGEYADINKYENSKAYKEIRHLMEDGDEELWSMNIDKELSLLNN
jgi:inorganic pyrophosphatase/exopolyphosphatase